MHDILPERRLDAFIRELKGQILNYSNLPAVLGNVWRKKRANLNLLLTAVNYFPLPLQKVTFVTKITGNMHKSISLGGGGKSYIIYIIYIL